MTLPAEYRPNVVSDDDAARRLMLEAIDVWNKGRKPGLADLDEHETFCRAADTFPAESSST